MGDTLKRFIERKALGYNFDLLIDRTEPWVWEIIAEYFTA